MENRLAVPHPDQSFSAFSLVAQCVRRLLKWNTPDSDKTLPIRRPSEILIRDAILDGLRSIDSVATFGNRRLEEIELPDDECIEKLCVLLPDWHLAKDL